MRWNKLQSLIFILFISIANTVFGQQAKFTVNGNKVNSNATINTCINTVLSFNNTVNSAYGYQWLFQGGSPASANSSPTSVSYINAGTFKVIHTYFVAGSSFSDSVNILVSNTFPTAAFTFAPTTLVCGNNNFSFSSSGSSGGPLSYKWDFKDGSTSTQANPSHAFTKAIGNGGQTSYAVSLTVSNASGCSHTTNSTVTVLQVPDITLSTTDETTIFPPGSDTITFRNCDNLVSHIFNFSNNSTTIATNKDYTIDWGDGSGVVTMATWPAGQVLTHSFPRGLTNMTVTAVNPAGCQTVKKYGVFVGSNPSGGFATSGNTTGLCAPSQIDFIINNTQNNGNGTRYIFYVSDGSSPVLMQHPPPATVSHIFDKSSCGFTSIDNTPNAFYATLRIENPCEPPTSLTISPILVSGKPNPVIVTNPNICTNTNSSISHTGEYGVLANVGGCTNAGKQVWNISPATGYTISTGSFGNAGADVTNSLGWTNGTQNLSLNFTQPGTYTVKLYMSNTRCGLDSTIQTICVRNPPTASFTLDKNSGCGPLDVKVNNTSPVGPCGGERYSWNIIYADPQACGSTSNYSYKNATTNTSRNPEITFINPGRYILELTVTANAGCAAPVVRDTVYVLAKPKATLSTINSVCAGNSVSPTATVINCYASQTATYTWQFTGGNPATSTNAMPGAIVYNTQGSFIVNLSVSNECGATAISTPVNITGKPNANAGADKQLCSGQTAQLGVAASGFAFLWKPATYLSNPNIANPIVSPALNKDTTLEYVLTVSAGANCVSTDTVLVTVKPTPLVVATPATTSICTGASASLTATGADSYSWSPAAGLNVSNQATVTASPTNTTNYTVTGTLLNGCFSTATAQVKLVAFSPANAGPDKMYCSGKTVTIGTTDQGMNYSWKPATGLSNPAIAMPTVNFTYSGNTSDTTLEYILTASAGGTCSSTDTVLVTVKRSPLLNVSPTSTDICPGGSVALNASGADTYTWFPVAGLNISNQPAVIANPASSTLYTITGTLANGCNATATTQVNVKAKPVVKAGADTITCNNTTAIQLLGTPIGGTWDGNAFMTTTGIFNPSLSGNGQFKARYNYSINGCDNADSITVTVTNPPISNAGIDQAFCTGTGTVQLLGQPAGGKWSGSAVVSAGGILQLSTPGIFKLIYSVGTGSCIGTDTMQVTIGDAVVNNNLTPVNAICTGGTPNTIIGSVATAGTYTVSYQWQQSLDSVTWINIVNETGKDFVPPSLTQTTFYRRIASSSLCSAGTASIPVKLLVRPDATAIFTPAASRGCAPWNLNASIINLSEFPNKNSIYNWFVNGKSIGAGSVFPGYIIQNPADSIVLKLVTISAFGCKNDSTEHSFVTAPQPTPSFTISDSVGCGPLDITIVNTTASIGQFSYFWDFGNGQTSSNAQPGNIRFNINPNYGDTIYKVVLNALTECDTIKVIQFIRVRAKPKALFTPNKVLGCSPMTVKFFNNSRGSNASFAWDFGDGTPVIPADSNSISHTFFTAKLDTFHVRLYGSNDCGIDTQQYAIVVNPNSIKLNFAVNGNQVNGCAPHAVLFVNNTVGANQFVWKFGDGSPDLTSTKGVDSVWHTYTKTGNYTVQLFATNSCSDTSTSLNIVVAEKPLVSFTASQQTICVGTQLQLNNTSDAGLAWNWRFGDGTSSSAINPTKAYTVPGTYKIWLIGTKSFSQGFGCSDSSFVDLIVRDTLPGNFTIDKSSGCAPLTVTFKNQNRPSINTIWNFDDGSKASGDSVVHVFNTPGTYQVAMLAQAPTGCKYKLEQAVVVTGNSGELRYNSGYVCPGNPVQFEVISNNTSTYKFYFGNGDSLVSNNSKINYTYKQPGVYVPSVMLITNGCTRILKGIDTIHTDLVNAGFKFTEIQSCGSTQLKFTDTSDAYFGIAQWNWTFGDGTGSTLKNPSKIYNNAGVYNVQLTITGNRGCIDKVTIPITVDIKTKPVSTIVGDSVACTGIKLALLAAVQSNEPLQASSWNFGNGTFATGSNASLLYNAAGTYNVTLISRTSFGCADTVSKQIKVNPSPVVNAGPDKRICLGQSTQLNAFGAVQYTWSPTQGLSCFNCSNPVASPAITTNYAVTGTNSFGCPNTDSIIVEVIQPFKISVTANDTLCIGQSSQLFASGANSYRWNPAVGLNNTSIPNPIAKPVSTTLYRVVGFDAYNCFTDTAYTTVAVGQYPVVKLGGGNLVVAGTAIQFNPLISNGPFKNYTWTPATDLSCNNCPKPVATINNNITYTLKAENIYGCSGTDTISYQVMCSKDDQVYIPNAFSPDGDGINDVFMVYGKGIKVDYFRVYNRWGQVVFDGGSNYLPNLPQYGWDGKVNGKPATQDVYVYTVQLKCTAGGTFTYKGNVSLLLMR